MLVFEWSKISVNKVWVCIFRDNDFIATNIASLHVMTFIFARVAGHGLVITASDPLPNLEVFAIRPAPRLGIRTFSSLAFLHL